MNRTFLDELYRKLFLLRKAREEIGNLSTINMDEVQMASYRVDCNNLQIQESMLSELIDFYLDAHFDKAF